MTRLSWKPSYCMITLAFVFWGTDTLFVAAAKDGWNGRTWQSTRGRMLQQTQQPTKLQRRWKRNLYNNKCKRRIRNENNCQLSTTSLSTTTILAETLRGGAGGGPGGFDPDSYYGNNEASSFAEYDESQQQQQQQQQGQDYDPYVSPRRRRRLNNEDESSYYGDPPDDRYPYDKYDDNYYDDRGRPPSRPTAFSASATAASSVRRLQNMVQHGDKQVGFILIAFGSLFTFMGIVLFFQKALMRLGNLLLVAGVPVTIGPGRTAGYFFQPQKARATGCLAVGIFLVFVGMPVIGMILEIFGLLNLFGNMFPMIWAVVKHMPIVSTVIGSNNNNNNNNRNRPRQDQYYDDRTGQYYDEPRYSGNNDEPDDDSYQGAEPYY